MPSAQAQPSAARYRLRWRGDISGPFTAEDVRLQLRRGSISRFHQVSEDGTAWRQLQEHPELLPEAEAERVPSLAVAGPDGTAPLRCTPAAPQQAAAPPPPAAASSEAWYVECDGVAAGPLSLVDVRAMLDTGRFAAARVRQGAAGEWLPQAAWAELAGGRGVPHATGPAVVAGAPAGLGRRCSAAFLDLLLAALANGCVLIGLAQAGVSPNQLGSRGLVLVVAAEVYVAWLYSALTESSIRQATLGKLLVGVRVTDLSGRRLSLGRASARFFAKGVTALSLGIGLLPVAFSQQRQALHDRLAGTQVRR